MGVCFSCIPSPPTIKNVRVVHLNGHVEDFEHPVTVKQVTGKVAVKHVVCTPAELLSVGVKPLQPTTELEAGRIYLMLPHSTFLAHQVSPMDLASMVKRLTATAKSSSRRRSPGNTKPPEQEQQRDSHNMTGFGGKRSWKPVLDPIRERSFNRMSDSDLQQHHNLEADLRQSLGM